MGRDGHSPGLTLAAVGDLTLNRMSRQQIGHPWVREGQVRGLGPEAPEP